VAELFAKPGIAPRVTMYLDGKPGRRSKAIFWKNGNRTTLCAHRSQRHHR
jgi:hypothetical protein